MDPLFEFGMHSIESYLLHHRVKVLKEMFVIKSNSKALPMITELNK